MSSRERSRLPFPLASRLVAPLAVLAGLLATGVLATYLRQGQPGQAWLAGVLLAGILLAGAVRGARALTRARLRAVWDTFAEGELAQERQRQARQRTLTILRRRPRAPKATRQR